MRGESNTPALVLSTDRPVTGRTDWSALFPKIFEAVRLHFGDFKVAEQLAGLMDCDVRSAARYLAGDRVPDGISTFNLLFDPVLGPIILECLIDRARAALDPGQFQRFEKVMAKAALRALVREENASG